MMYREMVIRAWGAEGDTDEEFGHRLSVLGDWLGNEGSRASQFSDGEPVEDPGDDWEVAFQEDRPDEFD